MIINPRLKGHNLAFQLQTLFVVCFVMIMIMLFFLVEKNQFSVLSAIGISSLSSSSFTLFFLPTTVSASPRRAIGGYFIAILCGVCFHLLSQKMLTFFPFHQLITYGITLGVSVGCAVFFMSVFGFEHPPALGFAVGIILQDWNIYILALAAAGIVFLGVMKHLLRKHLVDIA